MSRALILLILVYGIVAYAVFFVTFLDAIGFTTGVVVPKDVDSGAAGPIGAAIAIGVLLLAAFTVQHTIMARPAFKARLTKVIPLIPWPPSRGHAAERAS
jgi:protein-S-isoprenylcysteine O-methyltransferase Ste14